MVRGARAFTLVELLVVVAVIALLVGLAIPALGRARAGAGDAVCAANLRQCFTVSRAFATDHDGLGPAIGQPYASAPNWALVVLEASGVAQTGPGAYRERSVLVCPAAALALNAAMTRTYAMNGTGHNRDIAWNDDPDRYDDAFAPGQKHVGVRFDLFAHPSLAPLLIDAAQNTQTPPLPPERCASVIDFRPEANMSDRIGRWHAVTTGASQRRAVMGLNACMLDGSVALAANPAPVWASRLP